MALVEVINSSGGAAGDGINVTLPDSTPNNKIVYLFSNKLKKGMKSKDETQHMVKNRTRTTKLGILHQTATVSQALIPTASIVELNAMDQQLDKWMLDGNAQTAVKAVYFFAWKKVSGNIRYKTFLNGGTVQNWLKCEVKDYTADLSNERLIVNLKLEESDT